MEDNLFVNGNSQELSQVLLNVLQNAANHTIKGSVTVAFKKENDNIILSISDTGRGIEPDILSKIFERGVTGSGDGMGLGLVISKEIISAHNGTILIDSIQGEGTKVKIILPAHEGEMADGQ